MQFAQLRRCVHKLAVALDFFYTTEGRIGRADFQRAVIKIIGQPLPDHLVPLSATSAVNVWQSFLNMNN